MIKGTCAPVGTEWKDIVQQEPVSKTTYRNRIVGYNPQKEVLDIVRTETVIERGVLRPTIRYDISFSIPLEDVMETFGKDMISNGRKRVYDTERRVKVRMPDDSVIDTFPYLDEPTDEAIRRIVREAA